jgi:hypothetical protein
MADTLLLGDNEITNCDAALVIEGEEVFRLRERQHDGQLVVDFDVRDAGGNRIAKVAKNRVVHVAPGYDIESSAGRYSVVVADTRTPYATIQEVSPGRVKVTGKFYVNGFHVDISDQATRIGGITLSGNKIVGFGKAGELRKGQLGIGVGR